jgi:hypothetical protein
MSVQVIAGKREWTDELNRAMQDVVLELDSVVAALPNASAANPALGTFWRTSVTTHSSSVLCPLLTL